MGLIEVPGFSDEYDAYQSELAGSYGLARAAILPKDIGKVNGGGIEIGCDGLSALKRSFQVGPEEISSKQAHFDMISGIHGVLRNTNITWQRRI